MRKVLQERLRLDGIEPAHFLLKPNLSNILRLRFKAVRGQVGYKLEALLQSRIYADDVTEMLFGDDAEQDAFIYSLYADLLRGRVDRATLKAVLDACHVYAIDQHRIFRLFEHLRPESGTVARIFIHLDRRSPTRRFNPYGPRVVPVFNWFQAAAVLFGDGVLSEPALLRVLDSMRGEGYTPLRLASSLQDLLRRGHLAVSVLGRVGDALDRALDEGVDARGWFLRQCAMAVEDVHAFQRDVPPWREPIDYVTLAEHTRFRREPLRLPRLRFLD